MHIHILGIAGVMTAPLAIALKNQGHTITGSDQDHIYPPISDLLIDIPLNSSTIDKSIDLAIVGSSFLAFNRCREEFEQIKKLNIPYIAATQYLSQNLIKKNSILIAGSFGKSTISALVSWILLKSNFNPAYFFGGQLVDHTPSLAFSDSDYSVVEADESINGLDTQAKFLYYPVKYLILTSTQWEHKDSYDSQEKNTAAFKKLISNLPSDGLLIYNQSSPEIIPLLESCPCPTLAYSPDQTYDSVLIGQYNQENTAAAVALCRHLGISEPQIIAAVNTFPGLKRRLEKVSTEDQPLVYDDFAQSASRVKSALEALKTSYPHQKILVYFEPHASFLQNQQSVAEFTTISHLFDKFILGKIHFASDGQKDTRVTAATWQQSLGKNLIYLPTENQVIAYLKENIDKNTILVHFSSGGQSGLNTLKQFII